jgi:hypothetical protein
VVPRARFRIVDARAGRLLDRLGLSAEEASAPPDEVLARARRRPAGEDVAARLLAPFETALDALAPEIRAAGPDLERALAKTRGSVRRSVEKLAARHRRALLRRDEELGFAARRVSALLFPGGVPQERRYGLATFAARHDDRQLVARILAAIEPFDATLKELRP